MIRPALALLLLATPAWADTAGTPRIVDADTLVVDGTRVRLLDIDAPEGDQTCRDAVGAEYRCGDAATAALTAFVGQQAVTCRGDRPDRYGRLLARCRVGTVDLSVWLAEQGYGVPYDKCKCVDVRAASAIAEREKRGIWAGSFITPKQWRKKK
jgi:endonuclease YncB( thermonuclease family)